MPRTPGFSDNGLSRRNLLKLGAGLASTAILVGCGIETKPTSTNPNTPTASAPSTPGASETPNPSTEHWIPTKGDYLNPDKLVDLSEAQLTAAFTINASDIKTLEDLAKYKIYRDEALYNMGCTQRETALYPKQIAAYTDAMSKKYQQPAFNGVYFDPDHPNGRRFSDSTARWNNNAHVIFFRALHYDGEPYHISKTMESFTSTGSLANGHVTLSIISKLDDNAKATNTLVDYPNTDVANGKETMVSNFVLANGNWYITDESGTYLAATK